MSPDQNEIVFSSPFETRSLVEGGEWAPIAVPGGKTPRAIATASDGGAAWLIAR